MNLDGLKLGPILDGLTFTAPYSLDDARALLALIHEHAPDAVADVHSPHGTKVFVEIRTNASVVRRVYAVV